MSEQDTRSPLSTENTARTASAQSPVPVAAPASKRAGLAWQPLLWVALIVIPVVWTALVWVVESSRIPAEQDYTEAAQVVRQGWAEGDALAIAPAWALRALRQLGDLEPTFDPLLAERPPDAKRLWVLAEPEGADVIQELERRFTVEDRQQRGHLVVVRFHLGRQRGFHAVDHLAQARVTIEGKGAVVACDAWTEPRWNCPGRPDWQRVGAEWLDVDLAPRRVLWAHPPPDNETLWIRFPDVTLDASLALWGGHTVHGAQFAKAPIEVRVLLDGQELGTVRFAPGYPLALKRLDTRAFLGRRGELALAVQTSNNGASHFGLDAAIETEPTTP